MRSIRRRAGWSTVAKKSGSVTATRSTGICSRANQTRTLAGMRSSVRMLWNSSATISIVARSSGVAAACLSACLRWCSSSSSAGVLDRSRSPARSVLAPTRRRMPCCASVDGLAPAPATACCGAAGVGEVAAGGGRPAGSAGRAPPRSARRCAPGGAARVIMRVSSPTSAAALGGPRRRRLPTSVAAAAVPVGVPKPPLAPLIAGRGPTVCASAG